MENLPQNPLILTEMRIDSTENATGVATRVATSVATSVTPSVAPSVAPSVEPGQVLNQAEDNPVFNPPLKRNAGQFAKGDRRINRNGRPKGLAAALQRARAGKPQSGCLQTLFVPLSHFLAQIGKAQSPWVPNLPLQFEIVDAHMDPHRGGLVLTLYSESFRDVKAGEEVPEFPAEWYGKNFLR